MVEGYNKLEAEAQCHVTMQQYKTIVFLSDKYQLAGTVLLIIGCPQT